MTRMTLPRSLPALFALIILGAGCAPKQYEAVVARVGEKPITLKEYEDLYIKSNGSREAGVQSSLEDREKFLDLVTKFRLKLADAYSQRLDTKPELLAEIDQYKSSLASSFLSERQITAPGIKRLYDSRKNEYRASHILLALGESAAADESTAAYGKADSILARLRAGVPFESLAVQYSQDPSAQQNKGDLYYFTAGQMVPPFEDAVFRMTVGEISPKPVRTQFGLHIIKLTDKRPARGEIKCSHIMIRFPQQDPAPADTLEAYEKIKTIQDSLALGHDFADLARRNSGDPGSASRGGDLGWFLRRRWVLPFDEVAQTLKPGQTSGIVRTIYGYHLIKCYEERPPKSFEDAKKDMQQLYQQVRFNGDYKNYYTRLQKETGFVLHQDILARFIASCDSNKTTKDSAWWSAIPSSIGSAVLISFGPRGVSVDSVVKIINARPDFGTTPLRGPGIRSMVDKVVESLVFAVKAEDLQRNNQEFAAIMREYMDGIMLYQIEQDRVWNSIVVNDTLLRRYFEQNREKFLFPDRVDFTEMRAASDSIAQTLYRKATAGATLEEIAAADSARMAMKTQYEISFPPNAATLTPQMKLVLKPLTGELLADPIVTAQLTVHADTSARKEQQMKLAARRVDAVKAHFRQLGIQPERLVFVTHTFNRRAMPDSAVEKRTLGQRGDIVLVGRRAMIIGGVQTQFLPVTTDERTMTADSLRAGEISPPLRSKYGISIIRLNKKDPIRQKSYEEAGTEVSSAFQDYESKRLEREWIDGLKQRYPVVQYKDVLKTAFAPSE